MTTKTAEWLFPVQDGVEGEHGEDDDDDDDIPARRFCSRLCLLSEMELLVVELVFLLLLQLKLLLPRTLFRNFVEQGVSATSLFLSSSLPFMPPLS